MAITVKDIAGVEHDISGRGITGTALGLGIAGTALGLMNGTNGLFGGLLGGNNGIAAATSLAGDAACCFVNKDCYSL